MLQMSGAKRSAQGMPSKPWRCCWGRCRTLSQKFGPVSRRWLIRFNESTLAGSRRSATARKVRKRGSGKPAGIVPVSRHARADSRASVVLMSEYLSDALISASVQECCTIATGYLMPSERTYTSLRQNLASVLDQVVDQQETVIVRRRGARDVALLPATELAGLSGNCTPVTVASQCTASPIGITTSGARADQAWNRRGTSSRDAR
jgi:prevent-host-death family protein